MATLKTQGTEIIYEGVYLDRVIRAYQFAEKAHEGQKRLTGEPYDTHPLAVADIAARNWADTETIEGCFLHDTVEDCDTTLEDLEENFGSRVAVLVDGVTKLDSPETTFEKVKAYTHDRNSRVLIVKLADRVHNTSTIIPANLTKIMAKYKISNPWYIEFGKEMAESSLPNRLIYKTLSEELERLTNEL